MITINNVVMCMYYAIVIFFLIAIAVNFAKTKNAQKAILYGIIMIPFALRLLRLK